MPIPSEILAGTCQQLFFRPRERIARALMRVKGDVVALHYARHGQLKGVLLQAREVNRIALA